MSVGISSTNPLDYLGLSQNVPPIKCFPRQPTTNDKKFAIGQLIILGRNPTSGSQGDIWYLSKFDSNGDAIWLQLLTGAGSPGVDSIETDDGSPEVEPDGNGIISVVGGMGVTVNGNGPGNTVTINAIGGGLSWSVISSATQSISSQNGYFANRGGGVAFTLPATCSIGDTFSIGAINAGGWSLAQNAGQTIKIGSLDTTLGVGGSLASTANGDTIKIVCCVQDTNFVVVSSMGNITVV